MRGEPLAIECKARLAHVSENFEKILLNKMGKHEAIVKYRSPGSQASLERHFPKPADQCADEQHLQKTHAHVGRHFKGTQFKKS